MDTSFEEGKTEGLLEGVLKDKIEGEIEAKEVLAKIMLADGEPIGKIIRYTQFSTEHIEALR